MQAFVPKNRRPRFELVLRIIDLNNIPLVSGTAYVKWRLPSSNSNEHHGATDKALIIDHRASWNYEKTLQLRLTIDRDQALHECEIQFDVIQEFSSGGHTEKNLLGRVKFNLSEYVDKSDDEEGIVRRYLLQDSKINSTLKIGISLQQLEGDRNFTTPPLKSAMAFGGITGVMASEQADSDDTGHLPLVNTQSREVADMQEMYRRTLAASWMSRADDLPADKLIEGLFSGGLGSADSRDPETGHAAEGYPDEQPGTGGTRHTAPRNFLSPTPERRGKNSIPHPNGNKALDFSPAVEQHGKRGSIEHQLYESAKGKSWRNRNSEHELSEFDVRLTRYQLLPKTRINSLCASFPSRGSLARYQHTGSRFRNNRIRGKLSHARRRAPPPKEVELDYSALGNPGKVLVVRERERRKPSPAQQPRPDGSVPANFVNDLKQDAAGLDESTILERIESFRSPHKAGDKLGPGDWKDLRSRLQSSFTLHQLNWYLSGHSTEPEDLDTTEWRPGTSPFLETGRPTRHSVTARIAGTQSLKGKERLSERILRDRWKLGISNEIGQLDIRLPRHTLSLLLSSENFSFDELATLHGVKIDLTHSLGLIRATGSQSSCESIREIVHDTTSRIQQEQIDLLCPTDSRVKTVGRIFTPDFLSWMVKTYGVTFEQNSSQLPTQVYYLPENRLGAEGARRTLNLALNDAASPSIPFSTYMSSSEHSDAYDADTDDTTSWPDRQKTWFRWRKPTTPDTMVLAPSFSAKEHSQLSGELLKVLREARPARTRFGSLPNLPNLQESVRAAVGKCLFQRKRSFEQKPVSALELGQAGLPKTFANDIPRAAQFIRSLTPHEIEEGFTRHLVRLVPTALHTSVFPPLELEFIVTPGKALSDGDQCAIASAKAILAENSVDYLLPEGAVDVRFTRKLTHELQGEGLEAVLLETLQAEFKNCLTKSMAGNNDVPLPSFTSVTLPGHLLRNGSGVTDSNGSATAEYLYLPVHDFSGTQLRQYAYRDQRLFYAAYESGPFRPRMTRDVFLQMDLGSSCSDSSTKTPAEEFNSFYRAVCALSFELHLVV
ncbi:mitochondrial inner-membrane-bound regulator-domain-containing protein [Aspergillus egyptiacus]|nr:mitochondrial inner-membrane-bound regulator-domain-containing protein [Aspergillus egyptiacus]